MTKNSHNYPENPVGTDKAPESRAHKDLLHRLSKLSPEKRKLLELKLKGTHRTTQDGPKISNSPDSIAPLSFTQKRLWFLDQLNPGSPQYNQPHIWLLEGTLSLQALEQALHLIEKRHQVLRMRVRVQNGEPYQDTGTERKITLDLVNDEHIPAGEREQQYITRIIAATKIPFNLATGPLFRAQLYRLAENRQTIASSQYPPSHRRCKRLDRSRRCGPLHRHRESA